MNITVNQQNQSKKNSVSFHLSKRVKWNPFISVSVAYFSSLLFLSLFPRMAREMCVSFYSARAHNDK